MAELKQESVMKDRKIKKLEVRNKELEEIKHGGMANTLTFP